MIWEDLNENLIVPDLEAENSEEVFEKLGGLFIAEGYCRDTYVDALKQYYYVGGMPEVVQNFVDNNDFNEVRDIQKRILANVI